jgi:hypothetical protein
MAMTKNPEVKSPMLSKNPWAKQAEDGAKIPSLFTQWNEKRKDAAWMKSAISLKGKVWLAKTLRVLHTCVDLQIHT